jgi:ATP-dependent helicase HrpA
VLTLPSPASRLTEGWDNRQKLALAGSPYPTVAALLDDCVLAAAEALMDRHGGPPWDEEAFERLRGAVGAGLPAAAADVLADAVRALEAWRQTDRLLSGSVDLALLPAMTDMRDQVGRLVRRGFVADVGAERLRQLPRYLAAVRTRHERLAGGVARDRALMDQVTPLQQAYQHRVEALPEGHAEPLGLVRVRWLLEEYRVSLWAQQLGTPEPVSDARIRKALAAV